MTGEPTALGAALDEYSVAVGKGDAIDHTIITARLRTDYARVVARAVATDGTGEPLCDTSATSWRVPADSDSIIVAINLAPTDATADCWITDTARDDSARNQAAMVLTTITLAIDVGDDYLVDVLSHGMAGIPGTLTPQDLPLAEGSDTLYALEDCHHAAVQAWLECYDWQALINDAIRPEWRDRLDELLAVISDGE